MASATAGSSVPLVPPSPPAHGPNALVGMPAVPASHLAAVQLCSLDLPRNTFEEAHCFLSRPPPPASCSTPFFRCSCAAWTCRKTRLRRRRGTSCGCWRRSRGLSASSWPTAACRRCGALQGLRECFHLTARAGNCCMSQARQGPLNSCTLATSAHSVGICFRSKRQALAGRATPAAPDRNALLWLPCRCRLSCRRCAACASCTWAAT